MVGSEQPHLPGGEPIMPIVRYTQPAQEGAQPYSPPMTTGGLDRQRRNALTLIRDRESTLSRVIGELTTLGRGDGALDISFPAKFSERPHLTFSYNLTAHPNLTVATGLIAGSAQPTFSGLISKWMTEDDVNGDPELWTGATLMLTLTGDDAQRGKVYWSAEGRIVFDSGL